MKRTVVVFDLEADSKHTDNDFRYTQVTVACALTIDADAVAAARTPSERSAALATGVEFHWWRDEGSGHDGKADPFAPMLALFDAAEVIVAFNGLAYDFPLLRKHYGGRDQHARHLAHRFKCLDPFSAIKETTGRWPKLDALLAANGLQTKSSSGLEAIKMWNEGRREELLSYCTDDVRLLAQLVLQPALEYPGVGTLPEVLFGLRPAVLAARSAANACDNTKSLPIPVPS